MTQPTTTLPPTIGTDWVPPGWGSPAPPSAPPAKRKTGRYIVGAVVLLFILAGVAGGSSGKKDAGSSDTVATTPTTTATPAATTRTTTAPVAASLSMATWASRYGSPDAEMLGDDLGTMASDATAVDLDGLASSCRTFQRHLTTAEGHLPTPDAQLTSSLTSAYGYYGQAATACISGVSTMDVDKIKDMSTYLTLGGSSLEAATARLELLS